MKRLIVALWAVLLVAQGSAADMPSAERVLVNRLIEIVAQHKDATFIRNGSDYSADDAANFMRKKFEAMGGDCKSADDFIAQIATKSSMSGEPYRIRFGDGREVTSAQFLRAELKRLRGH